MRTQAGGHLDFAPTLQVSPVDIAARQTRCSKAVSLDALNTLSATQQIHFGPAFHWLAEVWRGEGEAIGRLRCPEVIELVDSYRLHPALLDACLQLTSVFQLVEDHEGAAQETYLPFALESLTIFGTISGSEWWGHVMQVSEQKWHIQLLDSIGTVLARIEGYSERAASRHLILGTEAWHDWLYEVQWLPQSLDLIEPAANSALAGNNGASEQWLLFAQPQDMAEELAAHLQKQGKSCLFVKPGSEYALKDNVVTVNPARLNDFKQLLDELVKRGHGLQQILYLWNHHDLTDSTFSEQALASSVPERVLQLCGSLLHIVQALGNTELTPKLWLISRGCQAVTDSHQPIQVEQGPLWGLARTIRAEHPEFDCRALDLDALDVGTSDDHVGNILDELSGAGHESQIAYRQGRRYVARLTRHQIKEVNDDTADWTSAPRRVSLAEYGSPKYLHMAPLERRQRGSREVEVEIRAIGLNFRDVLNTLGMLKEHYADAYGIHKAMDLPLGFECSGIVVDVGNEVTGLAAGDRVMVSAEGTFASHVTVDARYVAKIPNGMTFEAAATIPVVFLTAYFGLCKLAKLQAKDRILIHAAAGGVGQAAIQIAQAMGAEIYATASPGKWDFLYAQDIEHVYNSRTLDFAQAVMEETDGQGVDVVLNSLNGDFINHSVDTLGTNGRFVEIGKIGKWTAGQMQTYRSDVSYYPFEMGDDNSADEIAEMFSELCVWFEEGKLKPISQHVYPIAQIQDAVRFMQQAQHRGKIVLSVPSALPPSRTTEIQKKASYLITGGLGGLGLQTVQSLADAGAEHLILSSRRGVPSAEAQLLIYQVRQQGVAIDVLAADVSIEGECQHLLTQCQEKAAGRQRALKGIIHAAGALDDGALLQLDLGRFETVMASKVRGGWHLHQQSQTLDLDFFVAFSSAASIQEEAGQGNYAAANAFLDSLMHHRQTNGLKSLSINWGAWSDVGLVADRSFQHQGLSSIIPAQGGQVLLELLRRLSSQTSAQIVVQPINWTKYLSYVGNENSFYELLAQEVKSEDANQSKLPAQVNLRQQLASLAAAERDVHLMTYLEETARNVLGLASHQKINPQHGLMNMGMDSLMAVEFRNHIVRRLEQPLSATLLFDYPTLGLLHEYLSTKMFVADDSSMAGSESQSLEMRAANDGSISDQIEDDMATEDIAQMLAQALNVQE
ncbi:SDR family NAD(P)-dependent oxidoreductase [Chloroflexi bacterium TSY]|nr:SDR family NAD(P)-dependent oxidoreductase [Chloroflexi bacterium TSY]